MRSFVTDPKYLVPEGRALIRKPHTMIDVGCGVNPQTWLNAEHVVCIEPHPMYYKVLSEKYGKNPAYELYNVEWPVLQVISDKAADLVIAVDFIEHLPRVDGLVFIRNALRIARQQVAIFTPWGPYPQDYDDPTKLDFKGIPGLHWQTHQSAWRPSDFRGWDIVACRDYHRHDGNGNLLARPVGAFWAVKDLT